MSEQNQAPKPQPTPIPNTQTRDGGHMVTPVRTPITPPKK